MSWEVRIRAFRANEDKETRDKYFLGLEQVLLYYGITRVTSQSKTWFDNDDTWLVVVETMDTKEILGGARMQKAVPNLRLPIEDAISFKDPKIHEVVQSYYETGAGELCGLWNSRRVAGYGLGSIFLGRAAIALAPKILFKKVLALCSPATKGHCLRVGFDIDKRFGKSGEFIYPKENLVATTLIMENPIELPFAQDSDRQKIFEIRNNPFLSIIEDTQRGEIKLSYSL